MDESLPESPQDASSQENHQTPEAANTEKPLTHIPPAWPKIFLLIGIFLVVGIPSSLFLASNMKKSPKPTPTPTNVPTDTPTPTLTPTPKVVIKYATPTLSVKTTSTPSPSQNSTTNTPTPTQASTRTPNPPQVEILFPSEGQDIKYSVNNNSRNICVGYVTRGGDTTDSKYKYNINSAGWTEYKTPEHLCFDAKDGTNTIEMRFINGYNEETSILTRSFFFENN
jgi:outer membrane biosynthesis protein TonB